MNEPRIKKKIAGLLEELKEDLEKGLYMSASITCIEIYDKINKIIFLKEIKDE